MWAVLVICLTGTIPYDRQGKRNRYLGKTQGAKASGRCSLMWEICYYQWHHCFQSCDLASRVVGIASGKRVKIRLMKSWYQSWDATPWKFVLFLLQTWNWSISVNCHILQYIRGISVVSVFGKFLNNRIKSWCSIVRQIYFQILVLSLARWALVWGTLFNLRTSASSSINYST